MANLSNINNILRVSSSGVGINKNNTGPSELDIESAGADIIDMTRTNLKTYRFAISGASAFSLFDVAAGVDRLTIDSSGNSTFAGNVTLSDGKMQISGPALTDNYLKINVANVPLQNGVLINYAGASQSTGLFINQPNGGGSAAADYALLKVNNQGANPTFYSSNNGSTPIIIKANGNVGIGTTSPDNILHIRNGDTTYASQVGADTMLFLETTNVSNALQFTSTNTGQQYIMFGDDDPNAGWISYNHSDNNLNFRVNATERMRIDSSGFGYIYNRFYLASASNQGDLFFGTADAQYNIFGGGTYGYMGYNTGGYHRFLTSGTERMRITSAGDILCTSDGGSDAFRVFNPGTGAGDIYLRVEKAYTSAAVGRAAGIILGSNAGNLGSTWTMEATSQLGYFSGADLAFTHNSGGTASRRVTFKDGGNVGIGTDSPGVKLEVNGSTRIGGNNYGHQTVFASKAAAGNNVGVDVMFVGHTHSLDVNVMVVLDGAQAAVGRGYTLSAYGYATATLTQTRVSGNMVGVSITYVNSGGLENYVLRVTPTYAGSTNPTIYLTVNGQSNSIVRIAT